MLENGEYQRVGETQSRVSNARVIAATNRDLRQEVRGGRFRADLYHRLSVFTIDVPPLRELGDDKRLLLDHFREFYARQARLEPFELDAAAMQLWLEYGFPGQRARAAQHRDPPDDQALGQDGEPGRSCAPSSTWRTSTSSCRGSPRARTSSRCWRRRGATSRCRRTSISTRRSPQWERGYVEAALMITQGNLTQAAKLLGIHRTTLYSRMQNYADAAGKAASLPK